MAKLKLVVDSLDDLEETSRGLYVEKDGRYHLDVDGIEDTSGLKSALQKERKDREAKEKQVKSWERLGKTPEEIEELLEAQRKAEEDKATKAGEWDKLRAQMNDKHQQELKAREDKLSAMQGALSKHLVDAAATSAIAAEKGVPDLLLPHVQRHVRVVEEDGEYVVKVVDAKGDPRVDGKGNPLSITDLVKEMKGSEIFGRAFEASGQSGSGKQPGNDGSRGPGASKPRSKMSLEEKAEFIAANGEEAYQALPFS